MSYTLPKLPYAYDALEPTIDGETMELHHKKHHNGYLQKLLEQNIDTKKDIKSILLKSGTSAIRNFGGGYFNHNLFWNMMRPGGEPLKDGDLKKSIERHFGTLDEFISKFTNSATSLFGSGWVWLCKKGSYMKICQCRNQDPPLEHGVPLLGLDVWEHAYYLKYKNDRPSYVKKWWDIVNWEYVMFLYNESVQSKS